MHHPKSAMFTTRPEIHGTFGAVASTHWLASASGMAMLEAGGNAFDAAAAAGFTLQVVEPHMNGPGGDMNLILFDENAGRARVICGQGPAPAGATIDHYRSLGLDLVPGTGLLATVIPGATDAWLLMLRDYGSLPLADVLAPAIGYARDGYPMISHISDTIAGVEPLLRAEWTSTAAVYLKSGVPASGDKIDNPVLADTYERLIREGEASGSDRQAQVEAARRAWSQGFVAEAIDRFCAEQEVMDATGNRNRGVLTGTDMAGWKATYEEPLTRDYRGYTVCKIGPWGQGPIFLQSLALLEGFDIGAMDPNGAEFVHTVTECLKLALADREAFYGDPNFTDVPTDALLSEDYAAARRALVATQASGVIRPGTVDGYERPLPAYEVGPPLVPGGGLGVGEPTAAAVAGGGDTCHIDTVDKNGNMVSATPSGGWLQSSPIIPELGFPLNSRAQMFWLQDGLPASLAPGKRPRTTLTPSFAFRDGKPYIAFGTPGGDGQDQWSLIFFLRHVDHGMNLQEAIDAPTFLNEHVPNSFYPRRALPGSLTVEGRFSEAAVTELRRRGHDLTVTGEWSLGRLSAATRDKDFFKTAANARLMQGYAIGR